MHLFTASAAELADQLRALKADLAPDGVIWVSWPKKASGVATDITEDTIREVALPMGLVDVKVCAVDATWSGLKLVIRPFEPAAVAIAKRRKSHFVTQDYRAAPVTKTP